MLRSFAYSPLSLEFNLNQEFHLLSSCSSCDNSPCRRRESSRDQKFARGFMAVVIKSGSNTSDRTLVLLALPNRITTSSEEPEYFQQTGTLAYSSFLATVCSGGCPRLRHSSFPLESRRTNYRSEKLQLGPH